MIGQNSGETLVLKLTFCLRRKPSLAFPNSRTTG